ncbi:protein ABHD11-like isoform X1 [Saccostrea echinata]|uniref:protein ABHD11-like isoform X1 n=2 Tax=Saccostrea echinata TaxID=191078 RepID=UPI002A825064|nr:protein ABHD11-like isoform X1 [Saccostrea echinata]
MSGIIAQRLLGQTNTCRKCLFLKLTRNLQNRRSSDYSAVNLAYDYQHQPQGNVSGPPLFIMHGLMGSSSNWASLSKVLAKTGRKIIRLDARNHGDSPHSENMSYEVMSLDVLKVMDDLQIEKACLMGHSMGGKAFMTTALLHPERVSSLIVVDVSPAPSPGAKYFPSYLECMLKISTRLPELEGMSLTKARAIVVDTLKEVEEHLGVRQFLAANLTQVNGRLKWRVNLDAIINNYQELASFPKFDAKYEGPTLFVGGERSQYISPSTKPDIMNLFPNAVIEHIPQAGHWVHSDNPAQFLECVLKFLNAEAKRLSSENIPS